jgi:predicted RNA binding protein YcfA (HicA-like mRNA interferase family)
MLPNFDPPRVARRAQPWALGQNPIGIRTGRNLALVALLDKIGYLHSRARREVTGGCSHEVPNGRKLSWQTCRSDANFGRVPRKIRQLVAELERAGFFLAPGGKGSHRKFRHSRISGSIILSGGDGEDAHHYQEKQVRNAIRDAQK